MPTIRLALCITELDWGGAERCLTELAIRADRTRFEPVVYCLGPRPQRSETSCMPALDVAGIEVHCLGGRWMGDFPQVAGRLRKLLAAQRPHIIHTFLFHANIIGRIAARRAKVPVVVSSIRVAERRSKWHLWCDWLTEGWVDRYVCVSRSVAEFSTTLGRLPPEKMSVIPNGIDCDKYRAGQPAQLTKFGIPAGSRTVTYVGRLDRQKGVQWLIETAPYWLGQMPDCHLLMVGEGPMLKVLRLAAEKTGISDRVHFAGWQTDVTAILSASSLLALPSQWEGMPNVLLEAMASRLPVVATDVEGVVELLGPAAVQQTVHYGDTEAFAAKVVGLLKNHAESAAVGEQNHRRVEKNFSIARMVSNYENLWDSLATR